MKKNLLKILLAIFAVSLLSGCSGNKYKKYEYTFFDTFDTVTQIIGYTESQEEFDSYMTQIHERSKDLHKLFDKYQNYEGLNNIKTINDNAGIKPVKVDRQIIDLLLFSNEWYYKAGQVTNIAMGPVIKVWSDYRDKAIEDPEKASLPAREELEEAAKYTDIEKVIIDEKASTVFLQEKNMMLDLGSVAKGYSVELIAQEIEEAGLKSALISGGGNIRSIGKPVEGNKERWGIGIQNPDPELIDKGNVLETLFVNESSVVSSGDYQRYFMVDEKVYHHIIDPNTLMPGDYYRAITIVTPDSGVADFLSTSAFLLPFEESLALIESIDDTEAFWVMNDGSIRTSEGMNALMLSEGASGGKK
nr:FAD:protein FMN transferase [Tissierella sp.]